MIEMIERFLLWTVIIIVALIIAIPSAGFLKARGLPING